MNTYFRSLKEKLSSFRKPVAEPKPGQSVFWAMTELPVSDVFQHFLVVGAPQSGKTVTIRLLLQSVLPYVFEKPWRFLIFDAKRDMTPIVADITGRLPITLSPFDSRGYAWDIARDITTEADADQVASMLVPEEPNSHQRFFPDAAKGLFRAVIVAFQERAPNEWTLRDVLFALHDLVFLKMVVSRSERASRIAKLYLSDEKSLFSVMSTVATKVQRYEIVAALWDTVPKERRLSINDWISSTGPNPGLSGPPSSANSEVSGPVRKPPLSNILLLGNHPRFSESLKPINQVIMRRVSDLLLTRQDRAKDDEWMTWIILDELREAGRMDGIRQLLNMGRSKGVSMTLGFQDLSGMEAEYGPQLAREIVDQCAHKSFLRSGSSITAQWAEQHFGQALYLEEELSVSGKYEPYQYAGAPSVFPNDQIAEERTLSRSLKRIERKAVMASEILAIPTGNEFGIAGFHDTPRFGAYYGVLQPEWLKEYLRKYDLSIEGEIERGASGQTLQPWREDDFKRLGLDAPVANVNSPKDEGQEAIEALMALKDL